MQRIILLTLVVLLSLTPLSAAEDDTIQVGEVVVTATRNEAAVEKIAANISVITSEEIEKSTATTVQDLLRSEEGIIVRDFYGTGTKTTVDMRGFTRGLNTVILVDGRRMNEIDLSGVDWNMIPLENVERIEIVRGSGSVLYGDNAMAGVINIITKKGITEKPEFEAGVRFGSYNEHAEYVSAGGATKRVSYFVFGSNHDTDGYRDNGGFEGRDLNARISANLTDNIFIDLVGGLHEDSQGYPDGLSQAQLNEDRRQTTTPDNGADYDGYYYDLKSEFGIGSWGDLEIGYSFNNREFNADLISYGGTLTRDTDTDGFKAKFTSEKDILNRKNLLTVGVDLNKAEANSTSVFTGFDSDTDVSKEETGYYIQDELSLDERILLNIGYRFSRAKYHDEVSGTDFSGLFSDTSEQIFTEDAMKAGLTYNYDAGSKAFVSYAKGYRLPTTDELFEYTGTIVSLLPEKADTYEGGIVHLFNDNIEARLTLFIMEVEDELYYNPAGGPFGFGANENLEETEHKGAEIGFSVGLTDSVVLFGNYAYNKATFEKGPNEGREVPLQPKNSGNFGINAALPHDLNATIIGKWVGKRYLENDVQNTEEKMDDNLTVDAKLSYQYKMVTCLLYTSPSPRD